MNATFRDAVAILAVSVCTVANAAAPEAQVRVSSSRELRVAVIDSTKASTTRDAMHQAFATSLGTSLTHHCGAAVGVRAKCVGVDHAAFNLGTGVYDAVLVIGRSVPDPLRRADAITLSAAPEGAKRDRTLYLLIANGDTALQGLLAQAFTRAMTDGKFLESFASVDRKAPSDDRLATAQ